ncbi:MAG: DEAD/DEAH box helicase [Candidatus Altiarchaeota archaeon]
MFVEHPLVRKDKLRLRRYQEAVVARAIDENTLVVLPTGLGKTIVAAMVAAVRLGKYPNSRVLFVAPTKPLAVQHEKTFRDLLTVEETTVLTGQVSSEKRRELWNTSRIIFATPQTIQNDLYRGLKLDDVSLIIFDEAHRAVGDYSYVGIAGDYVKQSPYPLILGLTASPSSEREKVGEIRKNLFIRNIEAKTEHDRDVKPYVQDVKVDWVRVELPEEIKELKTVLEDVLREQLKNLKEYGYLESAQIQKVNKRMLLGIQHEIRKEITGGMDSYGPASLVASAIKVNHGLELLETQGVTALHEYFKRMFSQKTKAVRKLVGDHRMIKASYTAKKLIEEGVEHPKLDELVKIVTRHRDQKVLVFTQYRDSVDKIIERLNEADILAHEFIGQAARGVSKGMTQKKQIDVLEKFKEGAYTALIATSVAEEGLDIPKVDAVVFYEPVPSEIRSIQRRGRTGRSAAGKVYVLIAKGTRDEGYYWASVHKERRMGNIVRELRSGLDKQQSLEDYDAGGISVEDKVETPAAYGQQSIAQYSFRDSDEVRIFVDVRERNRNILDQLKEKAVIEVRQLPVGDYLLSDRVCVERKTMEDFLQSIIDKRLMQQLTEMRRNFMMPVLLVEGWSNPYSMRDIHPNAIRGVLASIAVDFEVSIIPSMDEADTAGILYAMAKREQVDENRVVGLRGERKPLTLEERRRYVVESLPNVSAVLAGRLLDEFGSVEGIMTASESDLMRVEGIGGKKAAEIRNVVKSKHDK